MENADIKDLKMLEDFFLNFFMYLFRGGGGCTNACIGIGTHSQPLLQTRLMDVLKNW